MVTLKKTHSITNPFGRGFKELVFCYTIHRKLKSFDISILKHAFKVINFVVPGFVLLFIQAVENKLVSLTQQSMKSFYKASSKFLYHITHCKSFFFNLLTGIHPNLENPFTIPEVSAVVSMTTVGFISGSFEMVCKIRDPKCYVRGCALFQTGVSCCREVKLINCRGMADIKDTSASSPCLSYRFYHILA